MRHLKPYKIFLEEAEFDVNITDEPDIKMAKEKLTTLKNQLTEYKTKKPLIDNAYLTIKVDLVGKKTNAGKTLENQAAVTAYLLDAAGLAVVPFYAFGTDKNSPWYRLSVGTCKKEEIATVLF